MPTAPKVYYEAEEPASDFTPDALPQAEEQHLEYGEVFSQDEDTAPVIVVAAPAATFAYALGHRVQPAPEAPAREIIWRGQLRERRPDTGLIHRTNVYRLNDGFWDCYREDELRAA